MNKLCHWVRSITEGSATLCVPCMPGVLRKRGECCVSGEDVLMFWKGDVRILGPKSVISTQSSTFVCWVVCPTFWHHNMTLSSMTLTLKDIHYWLTKKKSQNKIFKAYSSVLGRVQSYPQPCAACELQARWRSSFIFMCGSWLSPSVFCCSSRMAQIWRLANSSIYLAHSPVGWRLGARKSFLQEGGQDFMLPYPMLKVDE